MSAKDRLLGRLRSLRTCGTILVALTAAVALGPVHARTVGYPLVARIEGGLVRGQIERGVIAFKGMPYAAPPVGALRWAPPQPVRPWNGVRPALAYGPDCMQVLFPGDAAPERTVPQENCLYLNVWRPRGASLYRLPVMVWIYGGGFVNGGTSPAVYNGTRFARDGVVLVSFNYRLGNFGFFAFPELTRQDRGQMLGDYAFMDQLAALRWVQHNIRAFGGNPHNVTVFGESAGGMSVNNLLISPLAVGLFQRAIIESGGGRPLFPARALTGSPSSAEAMGVRLARRFGILGQGVLALARLRELPASRLVDGLNMATMTAAEQNGYVGGPIRFDGLYEGEPTHVYAEHPDFGNHVPVMLGANSGDLGFLQAKSIHALFAMFGPRAAQARAAFDPSGRLTLQQAAWRVGGALTMIEPARAIAHDLSSRGQPVYEYRFSYVATSIRHTPLGKLGAMHASEIPYVFDTVRAYSGERTSAQDERVARQMHAYWVAFAKTGKPDPKGLPPWPRYTARTDRLMNFTGRGPVPEADPWRTRLDLAEWYSEQRERRHARSAR
ncbi:MAG: carboxylesterase family protein [Pseudomonadota bacterium]|jgi:para-nitrobenzyl esterase|nr:carboxylesterase family protein [Pseudomonadota bacterium]